MVSAVSPRIFPAAHPAPAAARAGGSARAPLRRVPPAQSSTSVPVRRASALDTPPAGRWRDHALLAFVVLLLHGGVGAAFLFGQSAPPTPAPKRQTVELVRPPIVPPQAVEPPKPEPEPPKPLPQKLAAKPPPKPVSVAASPPALRTRAADSVIAPDALTVPENTSAAPSTGPVVAAPPAPPAPPVPPAVEAVSEASASAAYLHNPPPVYPAVAERQGWQGRVLLRVLVSAAGTAQSVEIQKSSGRKLLDDAALSTVRNWRFVPSKRGNTPIEGWASVPIEFKLAN